MKKISFIPFLFLFVSHISCNKKNYHNENEINQILKQDSVKKLLFNQHSILSDGTTVSINYNDPNYVDTVLILKNRYTEKLKLSQINSGRVLVRDSSELCEKTIDLDKRRVVIQNILFVDSSRISCVQWVAQYLSEEGTCIELDRTIVTGN